jgi:hypothetical protein
LWWRIHLALQEFSWADLENKRRKAKVRCVDIFDLLLWKLHGKLIVPTEHPLSRKVENPREKELSSKRNSNN